MGVAAAIAGSAVIGGIATTVAGSKAAKATKAAAEQSAAVEKYIYDTTREDYKPFREVGYGALGKLAGMYGIGTDGKPTSNAPDYSAFYKSPDYTFRRAEGEKAINRAAAARGMWNSGATVKALDRYNQDLAGSGYDAFANRLAALAGVGQTATGSVAQAGQQYAGGVSSALQQAGAARASAYQNTGSAINNTLNNAAGIYAYSKGMGGFNPVINN